MATLVQASFRMAKIPMRVRARDGKWRRPGGLRLIAGSFVRCVTSDHSLADYLRAFGGTEKPAGAGTSGPWRRASRDDRGVGTVTGVRRHVDGRGRILSAPRPVVGAHEKSRV